MTLRIALIDDQTSECEIGGIRCKAVPVEPVAWKHDITTDNDLHYTVYDKERDIELWDDEMCVSSPLLSAAALDLSGLPVVPPRNPDVANDLNYWLDEIGVPK